MILNSTTLWAFTIAHHDPHATLWKEKTPQSGCLGMRHCRTQDYAGKKSPNLQTSLVVPESGRVHMHFRLHVCVGIHVYMCLVAGLRAGKRLNCQVSHTWLSASTRTTPHCSFHCWVLLVRVGVIDCNQGSTDFPLDEHYKPVWHNFVKKFSTQIWDTSWSTLWGKRQDTVG